MYKPGNIWSGSPFGLLAALTNPTELARKKGRLKNSYPVKYLGITYPDLETAYKVHKDKVTSKYHLMVDLMTCKLDQHQMIFQAVKNSGGISFLRKCDHIVNGRNWWEGQGMASPFIQALVSAYKRIAKLY